VNAASGRGIRPREIEVVSDQTGVIPKTILGMFQRIQRQLEPKAEEKVIQSFRSSKAKTVISLKLILLMILVPLLTQQLSKAIIAAPLVNHFTNNHNEFFLNIELKEEALQELKEFEETIRFDQLIGVAPTLSGSEINQQVKEKAHEIAAQFRAKSADALENVVSDLLAFVAFASVLVTNRPAISVLKSFIDEMVYGLSDSAKAFTIILFTDMFVGYHSPEGWEVLLESISEHFGIVANHAWINIFIATVPVIMATVFKFWIFRYLNSTSPSAVATYKEMNE
jgi:hypothetical protein